MAGKGGGKPGEVRLTRAELERALRAWDRDSRAAPDRFLTPEEYGDNALTDAEVAETVDYLWALLGGT